MTEMSLKVWLFEQAARERRSQRAIYMRLVRGKYPDIKIRRLNKRVVFVQIEPKP